MKLALVLVIPLLPLAACKQQAQTEGTAPLAPLSSESIAEINAANQALSQYVTRTGLVPADLKDAIGKGAIPGTLVPPPGMRLYYDPALPSVGFVPARSLPK